MLHRFARLRDPDIAHKNSGRRFFLSSNETILALNIIGIFTSSQRKVHLPVGQQDFGKYPEKLSP